MKPFFKKADRNAIRKDNLCPYLLVQVMKVNRLLRKTQYKFSKQFINNRRVSNKSKGLKFADNNRIFTLEIDRLKLTKNRDLYDEEIVINDLDELNYVF